MAKELLNAIEGKIPVAEQYTSGEIAYLLRVAQRTACKFIDEGTIPGFRLPGHQGNPTRERRVHHKALMKFIDLNPDYSYMLERLAGDVTQFDQPHAIDLDDRPLRSTRGGKLGKRKPQKQSQNRGPVGGGSRRRKEPTWEDIFE